MPCIDVQLALRRLGLFVSAALLAGCASPPVASVPPAPAAPASPAAAKPAGPTATSDTRKAAPAATQSPAAAAAAPGARAPRYLQLGAPATPRNAKELRLQIARRLVAAHPDTSFTGRAPDRLLAIPVLEIELNADGSVRKIDVLRKPSTGNEATVLAIAAIQRAAPYGDVSRLPKPWKVTETFLFDDDLRFKPRTLDSD